MPGRMVMSAKSPLTVSGTRVINRITTKVRVLPLLDTRRASQAIPGPSPIRLVSDIGPVKGADNPDMTCGLSAAKAQMVVPANPGSTLSVQWTGGDGVDKVSWLSTHFDQVDIDEFPSGLIIPAL